MYITVLYIYLVDVIHILGANRISELFFWFENSESVEVSRIKTSTSESEKKKKKPSKFTRKYTTHVLDLYCINQSYEYCD